MVYPALLQHKDFPTPCLSKNGHLTLGQFPIYKGKKECQAALLRWRSIRLGAKELLVADFYLLIHCSSPVW